MESKVIKLNNNKEDFVFSIDILKKYYSRFYPWKLIIDWLTKNDKKNLKFREFCFTLENDIYRRYQSFRQANEFKNRISLLNPVKIDIGGIYNIEPRNFVEHKNEVELICEEKELIFDIDISDYDEVRKCCQKKDVCSKCWKYLISGAKILERILSEDFGFKKIFFDFSGRRGIHCWVCDKRACVLDNNGRKAIGKYISYERLNNINNKVNKKIKRNFEEPIFPSYLSDISLIKNDFYEIIKEQDLLNDLNLKNIFKNIICLYFGIIDMNNINDILEKNNWNSLKKINKISEILKDAERILKLKNNINYYNADACIYEFMMYVLYPRLDENVTIQIGHLLKGPFCVHPKTGYISVPMSIDLIQKFSFDKIPKVDYLVEQENNDEKDIFYKYVNYFENFVKKINDDNEEKEE